MEPLNANFIPLGSGPMQYEPRPCQPGPGAGKVIGQTKQERSQIAREYRLAAKKAKKKEKADAKRARKLNGILHRRMTKNPEKYTKNKERNRQRAIDLERQKIQFGAVHQCERLAAKHDPSGKIFNVGEVVVTPEGKVKSKEALRREAEREAEKRAEKEAEAAEPRKRGISKNQLKRQEMLKPKPVPPKPVIPEGITLPEGEENLLQLWDITDQEIEARLKRQKAAKKQAGKQLRKIQKEQKKLNRAMKLRKKQCAYAGVTWDPERARREIIGQMTKDAEDESDSESTSEDDSDAEGQTEGKTPKPKKSTSSSENPEPVEGKKKLPEVQRPRLDLTLIAKAEELARERAEKKALARKKRREERKQAQAAEAEKAEKARAAEGAEKNGVVEPAEAVEPVEPIEKKLEKKKKRSKDDDNDNDDLEESGKKEKSHKKKAKTEEVDPVAPEGDEPIKKKKKEKTDNAEPATAKDSETSKKKKKAKTHDAEPAAPRDDQLSKRMKEEETNNVEPTAAGEREPSKERKRKRDRAQADDELTEEEKLAKKERKALKKRKIQESNDEKLDRMIAEREAKLKAVTEQNDEDASGNGADHWNPDALSGDSARKDKFLRLLGAGKYGTDVAAEPHSKKSKKEKNKSSAEISKVQTELERQYEASMKMKHDGGSKRRGLGA